MPGRGQGRAREWELLSPSAWEHKCTQLWGAGWSLASADFTAVSSHQGGVPCTPQGAIPSTGQGWGSGPVVGGPRGLAECLLWLPRCDGLGHGHCWMKWLSRWVLSSGTERGGWERRAQPCWASETWQGACKPQVSRGSGEDWGRSSGAPSCSAGRPSPCG